MDKQLGSMKGKTFMIDNEKIQGYFARIFLTILGIAYVTRVRASPQSRMPRNKHGNVTFVYQSEKMGFSIFGESHQQELPVWIMKEYDENNLEGYAQPEPIKIIYITNSGRKIGIFVTFDFLFLDKDGIYLVEVKTESELIRLSQEQKNRYCKIGNEWRSLPAEEAVLEYGIKFKIVVVDKLDHLFIKNITAIEPYLRVDYTQPTQEIIDEIVKIVISNQGITINQMTKKLVKGQIVDIFALIASKKIFFDLHRCDISNMDHAYLYENQLKAKAYRYITETPMFPNEIGNFVIPKEGTIILWDGVHWQITNSGQTNISVLRIDKSYPNDDDTIVKDHSMSNIPIEVFIQMVKDGIIKQPQVTLNTEKQKEALNELLKMEDCDISDAFTRVSISKGEEYSDLSARQKSRIRASYREGIATYGEENAYIQTAKQNHKKGNREKRFSDEVYTEMDKAVAAYKKKESPSLIKEYRELENKCKEKNLKPPSYVSFTTYVKKVPQKEKTEARQGPKAANEFHESFFELTNEAPRHGSQPFEIGHIDHTQLDEETIDPETGKNLGRPWLTILVDGYTRCVLSFFLSYDKPSYRSCMAVIRECVRRNGRLPRTIITDSGKEFKSGYYLTLLAALRINIKYRPWAKPHFGSVCERTFGIINEEFLHALRGNTKIMKLIRQVVKSFDPKENAIWTFPMLWILLYFYFFNIFEEEPKMLLGNLSPKDAYLQGIQKWGIPRNTLITYDDIFIYLTLPTTPKGYAKVIPGKGVKINYIYYKCGEMAHVENQKVKVKYDPFDYGIAYVKINNKWCKCMSEFYYVFKGRSEREIKIASDIIRKRNSDNPKWRGITSQKLAEFLRTAKDLEILMQQRKDLTLHTVFEFMESKFGQLGSKNLNITDFSNDNKEPFTHGSDNQSPTPTPPPSELPNSNFLPKLSSDQIRNNLKEYKTYDGRK